MCCFTLIQHQDCAGINSITCWKSSSVYQFHHYNDVIMTTVVSQITSLTVLYPTVYLDADQRKHQSSASLAFVWGIHRDRWIPRTKGQLRKKCFHLITLSWQTIFELWVDFNCHFGYHFLLHHSSFCMFLLGYHLLGYHFRSEIMNLTSQYDKIMYIDI